MRRGLFLFSNDLRLHDNAALRRIASQVDELLLVYCLDPELFRPRFCQTPALGSHRLKFIQESLRDLQAQLASMGQRLTIVEASAGRTIPALVERYDVAVIAQAQAIGLDERRQWQALQQQLPDCRFIEANNHCLFEVDELPFSLGGLPESFSKFRRKLGDQLPSPALAAPASLPPPPAGWRTESHAGYSAAGEQRFIGGETAAIAHLKNYFSTTLPTQYKATRNALWGWETSTKFSAWLANGCLSPRRLLDTLIDYEQSVQRNGSTEWIYVELLWREYFQFYALRHGADLFSFSGIKHQKPLTSFYPQRFRQWCEGTTPYPIVNACMRELNASGYMSNRGRQIVASCFVHEMGLDWRYGAAYFQRQLIDYDVASNWGNWQYLAGVGADPRGHRHFDLNKQTEQFDPDGEFRRHWLGEDATAVELDHIDIVDWPILREGQ